MKRCPYCAEEIQDEAIKCRYCGEFLDASDRPAGRVALGYAPYYWSYEYRTETELFGWPLVHVARGIDPTTGRPYVAKGFIALGNIAIGVLALGGLALGGLAVGGVGVGLFALGGLAIGGITLGGLALGIYLAIGGIAVSLAYALGGLALAPHAVSSLGADTELLRQLDEWWPGIRDAFSRSSG